MYLKKAIGYAVVVFRPSTADFLRVAKVVLVAVKDGPNPTGMSITDRYDLEIAGGKQGMRSKTENKMKHVRDRNRKPTATSPASVCRHQFGCLGETKNKRQKRLTIRSSFFESFFWLYFFWIIIIIIILVKECECEMTCSRRPTEAAHWRIGRDRGRKREKGGGEKKANENETRRADEP